MARKKQTPAQIAATAARAAVAATQAANEDEGLEVAIGEDLEAEELDALASLAELGEGTEYTYVVMCLSPIDKRGRIETVTRDALAELPDYLRDRYGPGKYSVQAKGPRGYVRGSHRIITISTLAAKSPAGAAPVPVGDPGNFQQYLRDQDARAERQRLEAREDRKFLLQLAISALPALQGLLRPPSLADQAAALTAIQGLQGGQGTEKILDTLLKGLELGKDLGGGGSADSWPGLIREVVKDLTPGASNLLQQIAERRAVGQGRPPGAPLAPARIQHQPVSAPAPARADNGSPAEGTPAAGPAPNHPEVTDPMLRAQLPLLDKLAGELLEFAANGADPGLTAEALVNKVPRAARAFVSPEQLKTWLTHPDWWAVLEAFKPELKPYQGYCDDVRQSLLKLFAEADGAEPEES